MHSCRSPRVRLVTDLSFMLNGASPFWVGLPVEPATFRKKLSCCSRENPNSRVPEGVPPSELDQISQRDFTTLSGTCPSNEHYSSLFCSGEMGGHPLSSTPWAPRRGGVILDLLPRWYLASCSAKSWSPVHKHGATSDARVVQIRAGIAVMKSAA